MYFKLLDSILDILIFMCKEASGGDKTMSYYLISITALHSFITVSGLSGYINGW